MARGLPVLSEDSWFDGSCQLLIPRDDTASVQLWSIASWIFSELFSVAYSLFALQSTDLNSHWVRLTAGTSCKWGEDKINALKKCCFTWEAFRCCNVYLLERIITAVVAFSVHVKGCKKYPSSLLYALLCIWNREMPRRVELTASTAEYCSFNIAQIIAFR